MVQVGDKVVRMLAGTIPMELTVTEITDDRIVCGDWEFDRTYGYEIDEDLGWGEDPETGRIVTGSILVAEQEGA